MSSGSSYGSWGRYPKVSHEPRIIQSRLEKLSIDDGKSILPYGLGRSYGDCCLNEDGLILSTKSLDNMVAFDSDTGILTAESGVSLESILEFSVPRGWFLPVSPGTKFVTLGGAIANDVHGKNHHVAGTFGRHIISFDLLRSNGEIVRCSPDSNPELYRATIGGIGLTGLVLKAELKLKPIKSPCIDVESIQFRGLDEFYSVSRDSEGAFEYTVAWLDCVSSGKDFGRGIFIRGNHSESGTKRGKKGILFVPVDAPKWCLNRWSVGAFNQVYYHAQMAKVKKKVTHYDPFFYPLDGVRNWNRIYGKDGFFQFQCVVPKPIDREAIEKILRLTVESGQASFLAVLKEFGDIRSPGMMSFPRPGVTICLDFTNKGKATLELLSRLEEIVVSSGGALYPAKDACMKADSFKRFYPEWETFSRYIDPRFSSSFWRRVTKGI